DHAEHFFLAHDDEILAVQLDFGAGVFAEEDAVAFFHVERTDLALLADLAFAGGDDFAFLWLFFGGIGDDNAAAGGFCFLYATYQNPVMQGSELGCHTCRLLSFELRLRVDLNADSPTLLALFFGEC